jgi:hypothetical protein
MANLPKLSTTLIVNNDTNVSFITPYIGNLVKQCICVNCYTIVSKQNLYTFHIQHQCH